MKRYINPSRLIFTVLIFTVCLSSLAAAAKASKRRISDSVLRLHVIANSNSAADQAIKLKVRDSVLKEAESIFQEAKSPEEALSSVKAQKETLLLAAQKTLSENNCNLKAALQTGTFSFPEKSYGEITLPAGKYNAVRVIIGEGAGKNWWCVMFPPLCLAKGTVEFPDSSDAYLKNSLTKSEYELIKSDSPDKIEIRFKLLELLKR